MSNCFILVLASKAGGGICVPVNPIRHCMMSAPASTYAGCTNTSIWVKLDSGLMDWILVGNCGLRFGLDT